MHYEQCYELCHRYYGKIVRIEEYDGRTHFGKVVDVTDESVWIEPIHRRYFDPGFGYYDADYDDDYERDCDCCGGDCDFDGGFGGGGALALGFGFIAGIALAALFFI